MAKKKTRKSSTTKKKKTSAQAKRKNTAKTTVSPAVKIRIAALIATFILMIAFYGYGVVGGALNKIFAFLFGTVFTQDFAFAIFIFICLYAVIKGRLPRFSTPESVGVILIFLATLIIYCYDEKQSGLATVNAYIEAGVFKNGGFIGYLLYGVLSALFASTGALWAAILMITVGIIFLFGRLVFRYHQYETSVEEEEETEAEEEGEEDYKPVRQILKKPKFLEVGNNEKEKKEKPKKKDILFPDEAFEDNNKKKESKKMPDFSSDSSLEFDGGNMRLDIKPKEAKKEPVKPLEKPKPVKMKQGEYQLPSYELLNPITENKTTADEKRNAVKIGKHLEELLEQFGVHVHVENLEIGPTVTKYELSLEVGTRVSKILSLQDDIQMALAAKDIRIEAPIPGKPYVGIEVPNKNPSMVAYNEIFQMHMREKAWNNKLAVPLGKDISGQLITAELNKMPHLLIAGATGSGKSVCVNSIITSLLMKATPEEVKLILVDPKKVELSNYNGIPHLLAPVVTDPKKAAGVLQEVVMEMERRYEVFAENNKRNMGSYNSFAKEFNKTASAGEEKEVMPYIVVILDEVADLMMVASKTVEDCIMRLAQMARAAGIHMIIATQRPSTDIITGVIKANIPSRIAFAVSSSIDSRTILDTSGAEKLLGKGDMLFSPMGSSSPIRVQGAYVGDDEVARVVDFVSGQMETEYDEKYVNAKEAGGNDGGKSDEEEDEEYEECRAFVIQAQKASTSLLQRHFRIGYNKAARIIEQLEENGVIGPAQGSKPREVYIKTAEQEEN